MSEQNRSRSLKNTLRIIALALVAGAFLLFTTAAEDEAITTENGEQASLRMVETAVVMPRRLGAEVALSGILGADRHIRLSAESAGRIVRTHAHAHDSVAKSALLIEIDPLPAAIAVRRAEARVLRAKSELALARSESRRSESLVERRVLSNAEMESSTNRLHVTEAMLAEAHASLEQARDEQQKRHLRAPFAGILRSFPLEEGEFVHLGQEVAELLNLDILVLEVGLSDRDVVWVKPGSAVELHVEALPERIFHGRIRRVGAAAAERSRKFPVEIEIANADRALLPGMVARARFSLGHHAEILAIPREAVLRELGVTSVFVIGTADPEGRYQLERRPIRTRPVAFRPTLIEVLAGIKKGESIAISETKRLRDGEWIRLTRQVQP
ncbi:MAG: efflux RND transporter periplasmic adaptor subunit [Deltaproteobacteria bacterium]